MPIQQAQQLGRYYLLDRVAFGGMAEIFRAKTRDAQGKELLVAVKRVLAHLCEDDEFIQMLIDEARLTALLKHPNIARVYEFSKVGSEYFIAMEYVEGKDMRALLERARQNQEWLPEELIAHIGMQVALGLHFAYEQTDRDGTPLHIVHRDVSPSNVLLSYGGDVKLCDFGIAKAEGARQQTRTGVIKGKVKYMSPEQAMGRQLNNRSDLFSLGTLLYEMLALQAPFTAQTEIELLFAVRDARKRPLRELRPNIHPELERIIDKAMERQEKKRWENGQEFAEALGSFLQYHYPNASTAQLARTMNTMFAREIEKERAAMAEFVIDTSTFDDNVGQNLLADVLGPDAEYTQFTAAFGRQDVADPLPSTPTGPSPNQMRVLASVSMPGTMDFDMLETAEKPRYEMAQLAAKAQPSAPSDWQPSAQTMPRGVKPSVAVPQVPLYNSPQPGVESGYETVIIQRDPVLEKRPSGPVAPPIINDSFHAEETRVLSREQVDFLLPKPAAKPAAQPVMAHKQSEFHEQATQILDARSLPADLQQLLARKSAELAAAVKSAPPSSQPSVPPSSQPSVPPSSQPLAPPQMAPVPSGKARAPSIQLQPLDADFHEAATAYLDWSPIEPSALEDLSLESSSANLGAGFRAGTGAHAPIAIPPRSATGAQAPIAMPPRSATGAQPPVAMPPSAPSAKTPPPPPPPPMAKLAPPVPRAATGAQAPVGLPLPPVGSAAPSSSAAPSAKTPPPPPLPALKSPPPTPSPALAPPALAPSLRAASPAARPTGMSPLVARPVAPPPAAKPAAPEPKPVAPGRVAAVQPPGDDEWEALPHLDSTMLARAGSVPVVLPRSALPERPAPRSEPAAQPGQKFDPLEHTMATDHLDPAEGLQDDDLPTPVRGTSLADMGLEGDSEFAEDTDKGDGPKGFGGKHLDPSLTLEGDELETLD
ncbi:MAG: serine/threonine protein kinase [Myxococcales bacterium]|nr:serine/threonine protein kinase [Myxococcales bacterium]